MCVVFFSCRYHCINHENRLTMFKISVINNYHKFSKDMISYIAKMIVHLQQIDFITTINQNIINVKSLLILKA
jgi:hypothetical protein